MEIRLFNTLSRQKEVFKPLKPGHISMYHCGPTVYNFVHIGNLRSFIMADTIRRVFEFNGYTTTQVMNVTDIGHLQSDADDGEDKMTLALKREGKPFSLEAMRVVANTYYDAFRIDLEKVNVHPAHYYPFASDHIAEDIAFIESLIEKGHAYQAKDGIYFDTATLPHYGRLGKSKTAAENGDNGSDGSENYETNTESRIGQDSIKESGKKNFRDFAVWKFNNELGYEASFGKGFPGWHIECSVMSMKYLGNTFDIHTGGEDHIPVHHNNEIAQSEAISGQLLANYWLHNAFIVIEGGKKMAKSGENFITLQTLEEWHISPLAFRYWLLGASYRMPMQFSKQALENAQNSYRSYISTIIGILKQDENLIKLLSKNLSEELSLNLDYSNDSEYSGGKSSNKSSKSPLTGISHEKIENHINAFTEIINNDLSTADGLAYIWTMFKDESLSPEQKIAIIHRADAVFGLDGIETAVAEIQKKEVKMQTEVPAHIKEMAAARQKARQEKNWAEADRLRMELTTAGYEIVDGTNDSYTIELQ